MQQQLTRFNESQEIRSTITTKGQVTIPQVVRQLFSAKPGDQVVFRLDKSTEGRKVELSLLPALTLEETFGSIKPTRRPEDFHKLREVAIEEKVERELQKLSKEQ